MDYFPSDDKKRQRLTSFDHDSYDAPTATRFPTTSFHANDERISALKEAYDNRLSSLSSHVEQFFAESVGDEIYKAMRESRVSSSYAKDRLREILLECMSAEAESSISELQNSLAGAKQDLRRFEADHQRLIRDYNQLEDSLKGEIQHNSRLTEELRGITGTAEEKLKRKEYEWSAQLNDLKDKLQSSRGLYEKLSDQESEASKAAQLNESLRTDLERAQASLRSYELSFSQAKQEAHDLNSALVRTEAALQERDREIADLKRRTLKLKEGYERMNSEAQQLASERNDLIEKYASFEKEVYSTLQQEQKTGLDKSRRYKAKLKQFKRKLTERIEYCGQLEATHHEAQRNHQEMESSLKQSCEALQSSLLNERAQWSKRLSESSYKEADLASKHSLQIAALQTQYQKMLDSRVAEMQRDMEAQLSRSKKLDEDLHLITQERLRELETSTISRLEHEGILAEALSVAKKKHKGALQDLRAGLERSSIEAISQAQTELAGIKQDWEKQRTDRDDKLAELRVLKASLSEELLEVKRSNEGLRADLARVREELELMSAQKSSVGRDLIEAQRDNVEVSSELDRVQQDLTRALKDKEHLEVRLADTKEELERKAELLYRAESHFESTFNKLTEDHQSTDQLRRQRLAELEAELNALCRAKIELEAGLMQAKRQALNSEAHFEDFKGAEQKRQEEDSATIDDYRSRLVKLEFAVQMLEDDKQGLLSRVQDLKAAVKAADAESLGLRGRLAEIEGQLSEAHGEVSGLAKSQDKVRARLGKLTVKTKAEIRGNAHNLKRQLGLLKTSVDNELSGTLKSVGGMVESILTKFLELSKQHRSQYEAKVAESSSGLNRTWKHKLHRVEKDLTTQTQSTIKGLEDKASSLEKTVGELKLSRLQLLEELEQERSQGRLYKRDLERLEEKLRHNSLAFDRLSTEVQGEAERVQRLAEAQVERTRQDLKEKHEAQLGLLHGQISVLQRDISLLQGQQAELKAEQQGDVRSLKQKYTERLEKLERQAESDGESRTTLQAAKTALEEEVKRLKKDHQSALGHLQEQLKREKQDRLLEIERLQSYRGKTIQDIDDLTKRLADLQREVDQKTEHASRLARENREQLSLIKDYESRVNSRDLHSKLAEPNDPLRSSMLESTAYKSLTRSPFRLSETFRLP
jgi:chromosome segregation ATPase